MSLWDELEIIQIGQQQVVAMEWMDELQIISIHLIQGLDHEVQQLAILQWSKDLIDRNANF